MLQMVTSQHLKDYRGIIIKGLWYPTNDTVADRRGRYFLRGRMSWV